MTIKILGSGCKSCMKLYENTVEAVRDANLQADVQKVTDMAEIMAYGALSMPALVVDEKVVLSGRVPKAKDIARLLG